MCNYFPCSFDVDPKVPGALTHCVNPVRPKSTHVRHQPTVHALWTNTVPPFTFSTDCSTVLMCCTKLISQNELHFWLKAHGFVCDIAEQSWALNAGLRLQCWDSTLVYDLAEYGLAEYDLAEYDLAECDLAEQSWALNAVRNAVLGLTHDRVINTLVSLSVNARHLLKNNIPIN